MFSVFRCAHSTSIISGGVVCFSVPGVVPPLFMDRMDCNAGGSGG